MFNSGYIIYIYYGGTEYLSRTVRYRREFFFSLILSFQFCLFVSCCNILYIIPVIQHIICLDSRWILGIVYRCLSIKGKILLQKKNSNLTNKQSKNKTSSFVIPVSLRIQSRFLLLGCGWMSGFCNSWAEWIWSDPKEWSWVWLEDGCWSTGWKRPFFLLTIWLNVFWSLYCSPALLTTEWRIRERSWIGVRTGNESLSRWVFPGVCTGDEIQWCNPSCQTTLDRRLSRSKACGQSERCYNESSHVYKWAQQVRVSWRSISVTLQTFVSFMYFHLFSYW